MSARTVAYLTDADIPLPTGDTLGFTEIDKVFENPPTRLVDRIIIRAIEIVGIYAKRDSLLSIAYSEELISATISATLQSTDRHHGIVDQKCAHFQLDS